MLTAGGLTLKHDSQKKFCLPRDNLLPGSYLG